ncbi:hypothetical protein [Pseudalkalibacillus decolorationis]|uniref:hypothetical protein n=1 Tax=Pseudalkalibacillus decolorationis TaxID=163879 RepID=UPI0021497F97|nr:hypothetical protein [Pseudalkalibacillus decolorationis]
MSVLKTKTFYLKKSDQTFVIRSAKPNEASDLLTYTRTIFKHENNLITTIEEFRNDEDKQRKWIDSTNEHPGHLLIIADIEGIKRKQIKREDGSYEDLIQMAIFFK